MHTFQPNCTLPPAHTGFVKGPNVRSSLEIVWSCLSLLFLCTWSIQHLNVPAQARPSLKRQAYFFQRKIAGMLFTLFAPELVLGVALNELASAWSCTKYLKEFAEEDDVEWTLTHSFFANMGGFAIRFPVQEETPDDTYNHYALAGNIWVLNAPQLVEARNSGILKSLPAATEDEIADKNKGDAMVKLIALVQVSWLIVELIERKIHSKPPAQLEIMVLAYCATSLVTYLLLFRKPQDARTPVYTSDVRQEPPTTDEIVKIAEAGPRYVMSNSGRPGFVIPSFSIHSVLGPKFDFQNTSRETPFVAGIALGSVLFGCLHLIAWDLTFPHEGERIVWITSAAFTTALPFVPMILPVINWAFSRDMQIESRISAKILGGFLGLAYMFARLYLLVEAFRTLAFLSPGVYSATWTSDVPHIG
ncbi:hypothetical protein BU16DRAFT_509060 [Lophium mytilinum]|uniref:Uncharacterized protein n=1 Tax=Lophium mytilinum TaxID=390894 RepID=A0A6A6QVH1_9PEZI|nr:hypothetical protein BU16DRAFT_509060 [Lophium mytilinum]